MAQRRASRMFPTMPSTLFNRSESSPNLRSEQTVDSIDVAPPRTASSAHSLVDHTATALPQFTPQYATPTRSGNEVSAPIAPSNLRKEVLASPRVPSQTAKPAVIKTWRKFAEQVRKVFEFGRHRKKGKEKDQAARPTLQIGSPTNFEHLETWSDRPLRTAEGILNPKPTASGSDSGARRVRFADEDEPVGGSQQVTSASGSSRGGALTSHPLVTLFEEPAVANADDDDKDGDGKHSDIADYDGDSDDSTDSDGDGWRRYLASKYGVALVKGAGTQYEYDGAQPEHPGRGC